MPSRWPRWFTLQALASYYLFVIATIGLAAAALARPRDWWGTKAWSVAKHLAIAAALSALVLLPYLLPYWRATQELGIVRSIDDMLPAVWQDYLMTPARIDYLFLARFWAGTALFPGFVGLLLTAVAVGAGALKDPRATDVRGARTLRRGAVVRPCGARVLAALRGLPAAARHPRRLEVRLPRDRRGRGPRRLRPCRDVPRRPAAPRLAACAVVAVTTLVALESLAAPIRYRYDPGVPAIYHRLDARPDAVVADLPLAPYEDVFANAPAMLNSTASFYRLLNGFSGFTPPSYVEHHDALAGFPDAASVDALRRFGVTHVFVHTDMYGEGQLAQLRESSGLRMIAKETSVELYEVPAAGPDGRRSRPLNRRGFQARTCRDRPLR